LRDKGKTPNGRGDKKQEIVFHRFTIQKSRGEAQFDPWR
jgi:hypothetical protein